MFRTRRCLHKMTDLQKTGNGLTRKNIKQREDKTFKQKKTEQKKKVKNIETRHLTFALGVLYNNTKAAKITKLV